MALSGDERRLQSGVGGPRHVPTMSGDEHGLLRFYVQPPQSQLVCVELRLVGLDVVDADGSLEEFRQPGMKRAVG